MKTLIILFCFALLFIGCERNIEDLNPPIILTAKSAEGDVILRDRDSVYLSLNRDYYSAKSIWQSYSIGDTLK
jgi:hypothetical protein